VDTIKQQIAGVEVNTAGEDVTIGDFVLQLTQEAA